MMALLSPKPIQSEKLRGVYYTPVPVVDAIVERTIGPLLEDLTPTQFWTHPLRILEPACGTGVFLVRAYQYLLDWLKRELQQTQLPLTVRQQLLLLSLYGVDIDAAAIAATRQALVQLALTPEERQQGEEITLLQQLSQTIRVGNAVIGPDFAKNQREAGEVLDWEQSFPHIFQDGGFDAVIGNPPFLDAELMTEHWPEQRRYCAAHYRTASGNWDLFCVFIEKAIALCKPGGLISLIVPNKLGSAQYAAATRRLLAQENRLLTIQDYSTTVLFPASVYPIVFVAQKTTPCLDTPVRYECVRQSATGAKTIQVKLLAYDRHFTHAERPWPLFTESLSSDLLTRLQAEFPTLVQVASVFGAATVTEAYQLQPFIQEATDEDPAAFRVVNSGTLDRYHFLWGQKPLRYLGQSYLKPIVSNQILQTLSTRRQQQTRQPKIIVTGMGRILECGVDLAGKILAGKSTSIIQSELNLCYLLALLNSRLLTLIYQSYFGGDQLQGGYFRIGPPQLRTLPIAVPDLANSQQRHLYEDVIALSQTMLTLKQQPEGRASQLQIDEINEQIERAIFKLYGLTIGEQAELCQLAIAPGHKS